MQIDCYGFEASSQWFRRKSLDVYLMKEDEGVFYLCFGNQAVRPIHRIDRDADGVTRQSWAFGKWEDAETLSYIPINQTREIDAKDWEAVWGWRGDKYVLRQGGKCTFFRKRAYCL